MAVLALTSSACSGGTSTDTSDEQVEIVWSTWGTPEELTRFEEFNDQFMEENPDIKVTLQSVASYSDYHSKLLAQLTSGTAPDVFYIGDDMVGQFVEAGVLLPLTDLMDSADSLTKVSDFAEGLYGVAKQGDEVYAAPNDVNPDVLWYDKAALEAAGITEDPATLAENDEWTTDAFLEMNDKLSDAGLIGTMFWNYWATHYSWISSQGGTAYSDGEFVGNTDATTISAVTTLGEYFQDGKFVVADTMPEGAGADSVFVTDGAGFFVQGRYTIGTLQSAEVELSNYDIVRWPTPSGTEASTGVAASFLAINNDTDNAEAAYKFFTAFLSAQGQEFRLSDGGNAVPSIEGADEVVLADDYPAHAQTFLTMRDNGFVNYSEEAAVAGLSTDISDLFLALYEGKSDAQSTLDAVASAVAEATDE